MEDYTEKEVLILILKTLKELKSFIVDKFTVTDNNSSFNSTDKKGKKGTNEYKRQVSASTEDVEQITSEEDCDIARGVAHLKRSKKGTTKRRRQLSDSTTEEVEKTSTYEDDSSVARELPRLKRSKKGTTKLISQSSASSEEDNNHYSSVVNGKKKKKSLRKHERRKIFVSQEEDENDDNSAEEMKDLAQYISIKEWRKAKKLQTGTLMVKYLLPKVFTLAELIRCNYKGGANKITIHNGDHSDSRKEALDEDRIDAIQEAVLKVFPDMTQGDFGKAVNAKIVQVRNNKSTVTMNLTRPKNTDNLNGNKKNEIEKNGITGKDKTETDGAGSSLEHTEKVSGQKMNEIEKSNNGGARSKNIENVNGKEKNGIKEKKLINVPHDGAGSSLEHTGQVNGQTINEMEKNNNHEASGLDLISKRKEPKKNTKNANGKEKNELKKNEIEGEMVLAGNDGAGSSLEDTGNDDRKINEMETINNPRARLNLRPRRKRQKKN